MYTHILYLCTLFKSIISIFVSQFGSMPLDFSNNCHLPLPAIDQHKTNCRFLESSMRVSESNPYIHFILLRTDGYSGNITAETPILPGTNATLGIDFLINPAKLFFPGLVDVQSQLVIVFNNVLWEPDKANRTGLVKRGGDRIDGNGGRWKLANSYYCSSWMGFESTLRARTKDCSFYYLFSILCINNKLTSIDLLTLANSNDSETETFLTSSCSFLGDSRS